MMDSVEMREKAREKMEDSHAEGDGNDEQDDIQNNARRSACFICNGD
jgi:hypothetical protein